MKYESTLEIVKSDIHGRGVFASINIPKSTVLTCPIIEVKSHELIKYQYPWQSGKQSTPCICAGFGSFFNSSKKPNIKVFKIDKLKKTKSFITLNDISIGDELLLNYKFNMKE